MVSTIESDEDVNKFAQFTMDVKEKAKLDEEIQLIQSLYKEIPSSELSLLAKKKKEPNEGDTEQPVITRNVRVLNRSEQESQFTQVNDHEDDDSGCDYEQDTDEDYKKLTSYINQGLQTNESQNEQRRANLMSHTKHDCKGIILEAVLHQSISVPRNESP